MNKFVNFFVLILVVACDHIEVKLNYFAANRLDGDILEKVNGGNQELIIAWNIPREFFVDGNTSMVVIVRYDDCEDELEKFSLNKRRGKKVVDIFSCERMFLACKVCIFIENKEFAVWKHNLWVDKVDVT